VCKTAIIFSKMEMERKENGNCRFEEFFVKSKKSDPL
jgi:hypothetical protein